MLFNSLPHSYIANTRPSIAAVILQRANPEAAEFLLQLLVVLTDFAISDFVGTAPLPVGEVLAQDRPFGVVVAVDSVGADELVR